MTEDLSQRLRSACGWRELLAVSAVLLVYFLVIAWQMPVDVDEGYYVLSTKLASQGKLPYRDFFYTQMPYLPYLSLPWYAIFGYSWYVGRTMAAIIAAGCGALLYFYGRLRGLNRPVAIGFVAFFTSSTLVADWFVTLKTYGPTTLLFLPAFFLVEECRDEEGRTLPWVVAGALCGLSVGLRLTYLVPAGILFLRVRKDSSLLKFVAGGLVTLAPVLIFYFANPKAFLFNNFGFHSVRTEGGLIGALPQKIFSIFAQLGFHQAYAAISFQNVLMVVLLGLAWSSRAVWWPGAFMLGATVFVGFLPTPTFAQYHCIAIPFLMLTILPWIKNNQDEPNGLRRMGFLLALFAIGLPIGLRSSLGYPPHLTHNAGIVMARPTVLRQVSQQIDNWSDDGDLVFTTWPGYVVEVDRKLVQGTENNFPHTLNIFERITTEEANSYQILTDDQVYELLANEDLSLIISGEGLRPGEGEKRHGILTAAGYRAVWAKGTIILYSKREKPKQRLY